MLKNLNPSYSDTIPYAVRIYEFFCLILFLIFANKMLSEYLVVSLGGIEVVSPICRPRIVWLWYKNYNPFVVEAQRSFGEIALERKQRHSIFIYLLSQIF